MNKIIIRLAQKRDFRSILEINIGARPGVYPLDIDELTALLANRSYFYVAEQQDQIVGYIIGYTAQDSYDGEEFNWFRVRVSDFLYIDQIAVLEMARRDGVGSALYRHAEAFARERQLTSLVCEVNLEPPNPISVRFHAGNGFVEVGVLSVADGRTVSLRRKVFDRLVGNW